MRGSGAIVFFLAAAGTLSATTFDELAAAATTAREADRNQEAAVKYREALELNPNWLEGRWFLGVALYQAREYADAALAFETFLESKPDAGAGWILQGISEYHVRNYDAAFDHLRKGRALGANEDLLSTASYYLALLMNRFGEFEAASQLLLPFAAEGNEAPTVIEALGLAVLRKSWMPDEIPDEQREAVTQAGRAAFYLGARRADEGRAEMERLLTERPEDPDVRYAYGTMLIQGDPEAAKAELRKALALRPGDYHAALTLGTLLSKERKFDEALELLEAARAQREDSILARYQIATVYLATERADEARELLEAIAAEAHEFTGAHVSLATAYYRLGRKEDAERERAVVRELNAARQAGEPGAKSAQAAEAAP